MELLIREETHSIIPQSPELRRCHASMLFERNTQNKITGFILEAGRVRNLKFARK